MTGLDSRQSFPAQGNSDFSAQRDTKSQKNFRKICPNLEISGGCVMKLVATRFLSFTSTFNRRGGSDGSPLNNPNRKEDTWMIKDNSSFVSIGGRSRNNGSGSKRLPLLTMKDACAYLQCTPRYLERMVRAGRLRALKPTGKLLRFRQADIDAFLDSGATIGGAAT